MGFPRSRHREKDVAGSSLFGKRAQEAAPGEWGGKTGKECLNELGSNGYPPGHCIEHVTGLSHLRGKELGYLSSNAHLLLVESSCHRVLTPQHFWSVPYLSRLLSSSQRIPWSREQQCLQ